MIVHQAGQEKLAEQIHHYFNKLYILRQILLPSRALINTLVSITALFIKFLSDFFTDLVDFFVGNFIFPSITPHFRNKRIHLVRPEFAFNLFLLNRGQLLHNLRDLLKRNFNSNCIRHNITSAKNYTTIEYFWQTQ